MKVREMVLMWCADGGTDDNLKAIALDFVKEFSRLVKVRNARSNSAFLAIWKELETKWGSLCEQIEKHPRRAHINGLKKGGFSALMNGIMPEVSSLIERALLSEDMEKIWRENGRLYLKKRMEKRDE